MNSRAVPADPDLPEQRRARAGQPDREPRARPAAAAAAAARPPPATGRRRALTTRRLPANSGSSTCSSGSPVTGRMCSRGPATSISPGATTRSMSVPSSCQDSRRSRAGPTLAPAATATVSARTPAPPRRRPRARRAAARRARPPGRRRRWTGRRRRPACRSSAPGAAARSGRRPTPRRRPRSPGDVAAAGPAVGAAACGPRSARRTTSTSASGNAQTT